MESQSLLCVASCHLTLQSARAFSLPSVSSPETTAFLCPVPCVYIWLARSGGACPCYGEVLAAAGHDGL